jgi:CHAD domain-containing protein
MTEFSKWILVASADDPVHEVAARTIAVRLAAVQHYLPLAAQRSDENIEYVHQLRVATRRCVAALRLYRKILPKPPRKTLCRELKRIRQAAGRARDYDVLILRHAAESPDASSQHFLEEVRKKRCEAQKPLCDIHGALTANQHLHRWPPELSAQAPGDSSARQAPTFRSWARRQLRKSVKAFFASEPPELNDLESLHRFRIRGKELRYAMELLVAAFPPSFQTRLYPLVEQLQDRLGEVNDHAVALKRFHSWSGETSDPVLRRHLQQLLRRERKRVRRSVWRFAYWWTPGRSKQVHQRFRRFMKASG